MGSGSSQDLVTPSESTETLVAPICDPCVKQNQPARAWCGDCGVYLCRMCVSTHRKTHKLSIGDDMPLKRPQPMSIANNVTIKVLVPVATLQDKEDDETVPADTEDIEETAEPETSTTKEPDTSRTTVPDTPRTTAETPRTTVADTPRTTVETPRTKVPDTPKTTVETPRTKVPDTPKTTVETPRTKVPDTPRNRVPEEKCIRGCVSLDNYIVTIKRKCLTLYDDEFQCIGEMDFKNFSPNSICSRGNDIVVSFERPKDSDNNPKAKVSAFKDIISYQLKPPGCSSDAKVVKQKSFDTMGECFTTAVYPLSDKHLTIAAGMRLKEHPERDDIEFIVQIIKDNGNVIQTLDINPKAEPCFTTEFFLCATMKFEEIAVSEVKLRQVRGLSMKTGKTLYQFDGGSPQGLTCDELDNIYVYNDGQVHWIPPLRNRIHLMQQSASKKPQKKNLRMAVGLAFNDSQRILYKTCVDRDTIETFRVTG